jgi:two-component system cell cycle response regulator
LRADNTTHGAAVLFSSSLPPPGALQGVEFLAGSAAVSLATIHRFSQVERLAFIDDLTHLFNSRYLRHVLERETSEQGGPFALLFIDLDHFKQVNDTHGHLAGDTVLREGAAVLRRGLRACDVLGRYGGEEFLAVLPQVDIDAGRVAAERLRRELEGYPVILPTGERVRITASFGVASRDELGGTAEVTSDHLVGLADRRLYQAKAAGRNRVRP